MNECRCVVCDRKCPNRAGGRCTTCERLPGRNVYEAKQWLELKKRADKIERLWQKLGDKNTPPRDRDVTEARKLLDQIEQMQNGLDADIRALGKEQAMRVIHRFDSLRVIYISGRRACMKDGLFLEMIGLPHANQKETGHRHVSYHGLHQ